MEGRKYASIIEQHIKAVIILVLSVVMAKVFLPAGTFFNLTKIP
jgi:hypothetical protein